MIRVAVLFIVALNVATATARAGPPARFGRIDVYSADGLFDVADVRVKPGAQVMDVGWRGPGMAQTGATAQARVRETWREIWIEVTPQRAGKLQLNFQGEHYGKQSADDVRLVWVDRIRVEGANVTNGDLEELGEDGVPRGWRFSGAVPVGGVSRDGSVASGGEVCVAVWYGAQLRQVIDVEAGKPVRVTAIFRATGPEEESPQVARHKAAFGDLIELEPATVTVKLTTSAIAKRAKIRPLPLFGGADWAVTSRWDDNHFTDAKTRAVLLDHGHRGTFFLNHPSRNFYGNDYGLLKERTADELGRMLISGGTTVGGHSLTHPMMSYQNRNRIFEEVTGCRIALEAAFDTPVNAYAFSFCNYTNSIENADVARDIATALGRAGYLQVANHRFAEDGSWPWGVAGLLPPDGRPIDAAFAGFLADEDLHDRNPAITYSMHSWYDTPQKWAGFEDDLKRYGARPEWWYCNQNEYGAYRAQYRAAVAGKSASDGPTLRFDFQRPGLLDLNDLIPLTFEITGVGSKEVTAIESADARIEAIESPGGSVRFHVHHSPQSRLPTRTDHVATDTPELATSAEFPSIRGGLENRGQSLVLRLENTGSEPFWIERFAYRVPPRYRGGVIRRGGLELKPGRPFSDVLSLEEDRDDARYRAGTYFFALQLDFTIDSEPGRIYFTTHAPGTLDDSSYPQRGFSILGPIPRAEIDLSDLDAEAVARDGWKLREGRKLTFAAVDPVTASPLSAEVIPVSGNWSNRGLEPCVYLLRCTIDSPSQRTVRFLHDTATVPTIWLDGQRAEGACQLPPGASSLLLAYEPPCDQAFSPEHAGPMFRTVDAGSGERVKDIAYRP